MTPQEREEEGRLRGCAPSHPAMDADPSIEAFRSLLEARSKEPDRLQYQAFFDAALDTLRKGAPGLAEPSRVALARSIALKCQASQKAIL